MTAPQTNLPSSARLRVGLVGAGTMGSLHARVLSQSALTDLAWIADPSEANGSAAARRFDTRWIERMDVGTVDAIVIASSTETHPDLALEVLDAGLPLLVEKPLADSLEDSLRIADAAAAADVPLMCGLLERFNPAIRTAMEFLDAPVAASSIRHSPYVARIRTGVASDLLIHDLDAMLRIFGSADTAAVRGLFGFIHPDSDPGSEDIAEAILTFPSGAIATSSASRIAQRKVRTLTIQEADREISIDLLRQDITIYRHVDHAAADDATGLGYRQQTVIEIPMIKFQAEPLAAQLESFVDLVAGNRDLAAERDGLLAPHIALDQVRRSATSHLV